MTEALSYPFMQRALVVGLLVGTLCAVLSVYIVLKRWAFIGQGVSHAAFGGVALGLLLGVNVTWTSIGFCLMTAYLIGITSRRGRVSADSAIGIFLTASMALGVIFIWMRRSYTVDVFSYLFGNILATDSADLWATLVVGVIVLGFVAFVLALPLLAVCALLIRLSSRGAVIYTQVRVGKKNKPFTMYKLRTMYTDAESASWCGVAGAAGRGSGSSCRLEASSELSSASSNTSVCG